MERRFLKIEESNSSINSNFLEIFRHLIWHEVKYNGIPVLWFFWWKRKKCEAVQPNKPQKPSGKEIFLFVDYHTDLTVLETLNRIGLQGGSPCSYPFLPTHLTVAYILRTLKSSNLNDLQAQWKLKSKLIWGKTVIFWPLCTHSSEHFLCLFILVMSLGYVFFLLRFHIRNVPSVYSFSGFIPQNFK